MFEASPRQEEMQITSKRNHAATATNFVGEAAFGSQGVLTFSPVWVISKSGSITGRGSYRL